MRTKERQSEREQKNARERVSTRVRTRESMQERVRVRKSERVCGGNDRDAREKKELVILKDNFVCQALSVREVGESTELQLFFSSFKCCSRIKNIKNDCFFPLPVRTFLFDATFDSGPQGSTSLGTKNCCCRCLRLDKSYSTVTQPKHSVLHTVITHTSPKQHDPP